MKMLTEEQCAKCCPKMLLSWDAGALGCHHLVSQFPVCLDRPLSDCHFTDIQGTMPVI